MNNIPQRYLRRLDSFSEFINTLGFTETEKQYINEQLYSEESVSKMKSSNYLPDQQSIIQFDSFIQYLHTKSSKLGIDYIRDAIRYALTYKDHNTNFLDQFIKFILVTNFDEIEVYDNIDLVNKDSMWISAYIGGLEVSHNRNVTYHPEENIVECEWFHNRKGLQRTKLGSLIMCNFFKLVLEKFPSASIRSNNVKRDNLSAIAFYKKIGFRVIDENPESPNISIEIESDRLESCMQNAQNLYPKIMLDGKEIDYTTYKSPGVKHTI